MNYTLTLSQISNMKHTIGFHRDRVTGKKLLKYKAYRNHYFINEGCDGFDSLEDLTDKGLMLSTQDGTRGWCFRLSKEGFKVLSEITEVDIQEDDNE